MAIFYFIFYFVFYAATLNKLALFKKKELKAFYRYSLIVLISTISTAILNISFQSQKQKPYDIIKKNKDLAYIKLLYNFSAESDITGVSNLFELGLYSQDFTTKLKFIEFLHTRLISDRIYCEGFFKEKNLFTHELLKKINLSSQSNEIYSLVNRAIKKGYDSEKSIRKNLQKDKISIKALNTLSVIKDGITFKELSDAEKCDLIVFYLSKIKELNPYSSERLLLNGTIAYFIL